MYHTIQLSSCVLVQGEFVASLADGKVVVRDGGTQYQGQPIAARPAQVMAGAPVQTCDAAPR